MGGSSSKRVLANVCSEVRERVGSVNVEGRYHRPPRRIEDDYEFTGTVLGSGQGGNVMMATGKIPGREGQAFAVKTFNLRRLNREARMVLQNEVNVFLRLDHPHVCRLYDIYESEDFLHMVMECCSGGELHQRLADRYKFSERDAANATFQMLLAINYIHNMGIVHRDLKLENFLYDKEKGDHLKLIDFGFSCIFEKNQKLKQCCGTLAYMAPEVILKDYTNKCDLWSLGVIVHLLLVGYLPFPLRKDHEETCLGILNCDRVMIPEKWQRVSQGATNFVARLLERDASRRLSAAEALENPWIKDRVKLSSGSPLDMSVVDSLRQFAAASRFRRACMQMMAISLTNEELADVRGAFIELDQSKRGTVKLHELKAVLEDRFDVSDENCRKIFEALDVNNTHEIHYIDFLAAMMSSRIEMHDGLMRAAFQRFDIQNTGNISADQLRQVLGEEAFGGQEIDDLVKGVEFSPDKSITYEGFLEYLVSSDARESHQEAATKIIEAEARRIRRNSHDGSPYSVSSVWDACPLSPNLTMPMLSPKASPRSPRFNPWSQPSTENFIPLPSPTSSREQGLLLRRKSQQSANMVRCVVEPASSRTVGGTSLSDLVVAEDEATAAAADAPSIELLGQFRASPVPEEEQRAPQPMQVVHHHGSVMTVSSTAESTSPPAPVAVSRAGPSADMSTLASNADATTTAAAEEKLSCVEGSVAPPLASEDTYRSPLLPPSAAASSKGKVRATQGSCTCTVS